MKTWEMLKEFTENPHPQWLKAYVVSDDVRNDKLYSYDYISILDGAFYWNSDYTKPFVINRFYNPLDIEWEFKK